MTEEEKIGAGDKELESACYEALERVVDPELGMDVDKVNQYELIKTELEKQGSHPINHA